MRCSSRCPARRCIYYGDEIGMGDNVFLGDRNGVRTPDAVERRPQCRLLPRQSAALYLPVNIDPEYHYEAVNVEAQQNNPHSLLWWIKRLITQRKQFRAFGRGTLQFLYPSNRKVLAFLRQYEDERLLVVANLSRFAQCVELDLTGFQGSVPVEVFGRAKFPPSPSIRTCCRWGRMLSTGSIYSRGKQRRIRSTSAALRRSCQWSSVASAESVFSEDTLYKLQHLIPRLLRARPWFLSKQRYITGVSLHNLVSLPDTSAHLLFLNVEYGEGDPEVYLIPISVARGDKADALLRDRPEAVLARLEGLESDGRAVLYGATLDRDFSDTLLSAIVRRRRIKGGSGELIGAHTRAFREAWTAVRSNLEPCPEFTAQCYTIIKYGDAFVLKLYRKLEEGVNPGRELPEFLAQETTFQAMPRPLGSLDFRRIDDEAVYGTNVGTLSSFIRNATEGWNYTLDHLGMFFEHALAIPAEDVRVRDLMNFDPQAMATGSAPQIIAELLGNYVDSVRVLAHRTAELHIALSSRPDLPEFAPEPFTTFYRQGIYHGMLGQLNRSFELCAAASKICRPRRNRTLTRC